MKKPEAEVGYQVLNFLRVMQYLEELQPGAQDALWGGFWQSIPNDSYLRPGMIGIEEREAYYSKETQLALDLLIKEFPEVLEDSTVFWVCW